MNDVAGWTVVLRGIRYRPGRSLMVLLLAAIATAATVLAPAYSRAAQQSVLTDRLAAAPLNATSLQVRSDPITGESPAMEATTEGKSEVGKNLREEHPGLYALLELPIGGADVETVATVGPQSVLARLAYRDDACRHLTITSGACAKDTGTIVVSERSAAEYKISVGQSISLKGREARTSTDPRSLTVVGLYKPKNPNEPYWGRGGYFAAGAPDGESSLPRVDAMFVADEEEDLASLGALPSVHLDYRLRTANVRLDDVERLRGDLSAFTTDVNALQMQLVTALGGVLDDIDDEASALGRTVPIVAVPLVCVCWFILFLLVAALTEERGPEVALAKLRGYSMRRSAAFGRAEALWLVVIAVPLGAVTGLVLVEVAARTMLSGGVHVEPRWPVFAAAGLALVVAFAAVRFASGRTLGRPVLALLRRVPERSRWRAGVAEGIVVALAAASLAAAVSDQTAPLALLAPALLALVAGIVTARTLSLWSRLRVRRHLRRGRVTGVLAHAQLSRRPLGQRVMLLITVAIALLSFAATAWDVAAQARRDVAADTVGADRVLQVAASDPAALIAAVASADGDGSAMPVVRASERYGDETVELVGVPSDQLADVAVWRGHGHDDVARLAALLRPEQTSPLAVERFVEVDATAGAITGRSRLGAVVAPPGQPVRTISLGTIAKGTRHYRADLPGCASGCRLVGLALTRVGSDADAIGADLTIRAIGTGSGPMAAAFDAPGRWRANTARTPGATVRVQSGPALHIEVSSTDPGSVVVEYLDTPDVLPAALAGPTPADDTDADQFTFPAFGDAPQPFAVVGRERALPRVGRRAVLFDLDYAVRSAQRTSSLSDNSRLRYEVWASANAPTDLSARLAAAGLQILGEESIADERDQLGRAAPALGLRLYLIAGGAAVALAVGAVLLTAYVGAGTRRYEFAALRVAGVRPATLRLGMLREYLHLIGLPVLVGFAAGVAGAVLMLPGIPLVTVGTATGEITYTLGTGVLPIAAGVTLAGLLVAMLAVLRLVRRGTPDRLREGGSP